MTVARPASPGVRTDAHRHDDHDHHDEHGHDHDHHDEHGHDHGRDHEHDHDAGHDHGAGRRARLLHAVRPHSHDHADSTDAALESSADGIRTVRRSLVVLGLTAVLQGGVFLASGSIALLADTVHNLSDALTALPLWLAFALSRRPASSRYPYGLGRVEDLAGLFVVLMIAGSALVAGWESLRRLGSPQPVGHLGAVAIAGVVGFAGNELVAVYRIRVGRRIGSAALVADGRHARADGWTSLGVVLGAAGVALGFPLADPLIGLAITAAILVVLVGTVRDVGRRLLDGVDPGLVGTVREALAGVPQVRAVDDVRLRWLGHRLHGEATVAVDPALDVAAAAHLAGEARRAATSVLPRTVVFSVHPVPDAAS